MTLLVLMYHKASAGRYGNSVAMLDAHFACIARRFNCVLPGEALDANRLNVCLTFDDATSDFHLEVFPMLRAHGLRALLAVPVSAIADEAAAAPSVGHCSWTALAEMARSRQVVLASHGLTHARLDARGIDLHAEVVVSKAALEARTPQAVDCFVLPYGRFTAASLACIRQHYRYVFRIGSADNVGWSAEMIYRVDADAMAAPDALFSARRLAGYRWRRRWNGLRSR